MRTLVSIDGFNFYYNAVKNTPYKWLDFKALSVALLKPYTLKVPLANPSPPKYFEQVIKIEEKGSDVNLAVHLLFDASQDFYDCAMVISNDGDLAEAMRLVKHHFKKPIVLVNPCAFPPSNKLRKYADSFKTVRKWMLKNCQLPSPIPGTSLYKPVKWEVSSPAVPPHP